MERPWLRNYPPGVPAEIDPATYPSLIAIFDETFKTHGNKTAFVCMGKAITYAELDQASRAFARLWLRGSQGPRCSTNWAAAALRMRRRRTARAMVVPGLIQGPVYR